MRIRNVFLAAVFVLCVPSHFVFAYASCTFPLSYSIRSVDDRFKISRNDLGQILAQAETVWEVPAQKNLFTYATTSGQINVDLIYDYRQAGVDEHASTNAKLESISAAYESIRIAFSVEASSTEVRAAQNTAAFNAYKADLDQFNTDVVASNARGGATASEYQSFTDRSTALHSRFVTLNTDESAINDRIKQINAFSALLNQLASALNSYVARYNAALMSMGEFNEGLFEQIGTRRTITIYEYMNRSQLMRGLAHEMGHALGLNHVSDPEAIMYRDNSGKGQSATSADLSELRAVCGF